MRVCAGTGHVRVSAGHSALGGLSRVTLGPCAAVKLTRHVARQAAAVPAPPLSLRPTLDSGGSGLAMLRPRLCTQMAASTFHEVRSASVSLVTVWSISSPRPAAGLHPQPESRLQTVTSGTWSWAARSAGDVSGRWSRSCGLHLPPGTCPSRKAEQDTRKEGDHGDCSVLSTCTHARHHLAFV